MPEKTIVVISAPYSNRPTIVSSTAGKELLRFIKKEYPKIEAHFIPDKESIHENVGLLQKYAKKGNVLFCYYGHGQRDKACGAMPPHCGRDKGGMVDSRNVNALKNIIVHATACWTSVSLGRLAEDTGVKAYLGSRAPCYVAFNLTEHPYMNDIIDVWHRFTKVLLEGGSVGEGIRAMDDKSREYEDLYGGKKEEWLYADYYKLRFRRNINILTPFGDITARLVE